MTINQFIHTLYNLFTTKYHYTQITEMCCRELDIIIATQIAHKQQLYTCNIQHFWKGAQYIIHKTCMWVVRETLQEVDELGAWKRVAAGWGELEDFEFPQSC